MAKLKITDSEVIKSGERELLDIIIGDLDWEAIEKIVKEKHQLRIQDDVEFRQGDIVVYDNTVAYKLDFDVKVTLTVLFDRDGNYLSFSTSGDFTRDAMVPDLEEEESEPESEMESSETDEVIAAQDDETILQETAQPEDSPDQDDTDTMVPNLEEEESEPESEMELPGTDDTIEAQDQDDDDLIQEETTQLEDSPDPEDTMEPAPPPSSDPEKSPDENMSGMAFQIAEMLSEINEENEE